MQVFCEDVRRHESILARCLRETWGLHETEILRILEVLMNQLMHLAKLGPLALVDDECDAVLTIVTIFYLISFSSNGSLL